IDCDVRCYAPDQERNEIILENQHGRAAKDAGREPAGIPKAVSPAFVADAHILPTGKIVRSVAHPRLAFAVNRFFNERPLNDRVLRAMQTYSAPFLQQGSPEGKAHLLSILGKGRR